MNAEEQNEIEESLVEFVKRISNDKEVSQEALITLPEVTQLLFDVMIMDAEKRNEVVESLVEFVKRVSNDTEPSPAALAVLPAVARLLFDVTIKYAV